MSLFLFLIIWYAEKSLACNVKILKKQILHIIISLKLPIQECHLYLGVTTVLCIKMCIKYLNENKKENQFCMYWTIE